MLDKSIFGFSQYSYKRGLIKLFKYRNNRKSSDKFGNHAEFNKILWNYLLEDIIILFFMRRYLTAKTDPFEEAVDYTGRSWTAWRDGVELRDRLRANDVEIGVVTDYEPVYSEFGNVIAGVYTDENGKKVTLTERDSYAFIGMSNCRFRVEREDELFVFTGSGWGHNCGMSQWGARAMAEVYGYDCDDIIRFYYTGAYVG